MSFGTIGKRIKIVRKSKKLNQRVFSNMLGLSQAHISNIECDKDKPSNKVLTSIANEFNINIEWLKTGEGEMECKSSHSSYDNILLQIKNKLNSADKFELVILLSCLENVINTFDNISVYKKTNSSNENYSKYIYNTYDDILRCLNECFETKFKLEMHHNSNNIREHLEIIDKLEIYKQKIDNYLDDIMEK